MQEEKPQPSLCTVGTLTQCTWAGHAIPAPESGGCFHVNHILAPSQNPILPLGSYITTCVFLDEPRGGLLEGHILSQALQNTGQKEQSEPSSPLCLAPQWEWQRGWQHMNSVVAVVQCCTHGHRGAGAEMGDIYCITAGHVSVCIQNYVLKYLFKAPA